MPVIRINKTQASRMRRLTENCAQERTLPSSVRSNDSRQFPAVKMQIDMRKDLERPERDTEVLDFGTAKARAPLCCSRVMKDMPEHDDPLL